MLPYLTLARAPAPHYSIGRGAGAGSQGRGVPNFSLFSGLRIGCGKGSLALATDIAPHAVALPQFGGYTAPRQVVL